MKYMKVILLEQNRKLGNIGETVQVRPGYARNFLIPQEKAVQATKENHAYFESRREEFEKRNAHAKQLAEQKKEKMQNLEVIILRSSSDKGHLYGSVTATDIANACSDYSIKREQINIHHPIKTLGIFSVPVVLHPEIFVTLSVNVARSTDEAEAQRRVVQDQNEEKELKESLESAHTSQV